jgi:hypothetical protein
MRKLDFRPRRKSCHLLFVKSIFSQGVAARSAENCRADAMPTVTMSIGSTNSTLALACTPTRTHVNMKLTNTPVNPWNGSATQQLNNEDRT